MRTNFTFHINLDERGEFFADVRKNDETIFKIHGFDIFNDGFMRSDRDIGGLSKYLFDLGITDKKEEIKFIG